MKATKSAVWIRLMMAWLLGTVVLIALLQVTNGVADFHLREKHDLLLSKLSYYELVTPHRSTQNGDFLSNDLSTAQEEERDTYQWAYRRMVHGSSGPRYARAAHDQTTDGPPQNFHFSVNAFGVSLVLNVTRNLYLVSPDLRVERYNEDGTKETFRPHTQCFYAGTVAGIAGSSVAISNCDGLSGIIQAGDEEYVIEPLESMVGRSKVNVSEGHLHIIYRPKDFKLESIELKNDFQIKLQHDETGETSGTFSNGGQESRRKRRSADEGTNNQQYFVETLLAADYSMVTFHGVEELPTYLLTMLNIVNRIYRHHTMTVDITFVATRIILLNKAISKTLIAGQRYKRSMTNVFRWVSSLTSPGEMHGAVADYVSFVTKLDFGPAGFAPISAICDGYWSSSITRDQGLISSFVMAHEAGHVLGMDHDGYGNSCVVDLYASSIMNGFVMASYSNYYWSNCSDELLKNYVGTYRCLTNVPTNGNGLEGYPGQWYSLDDQCQYTFGANSRQCGRPEDYFICSIRCTEQSNPSYCYEYHLPALDGSGCGAVTQWCMKGICENKPQRRNGKWSKWSDWSACSYDCDVGVRTRHRKCNNPRPAFGGKECKGKSFQFRICNEQPCVVWVDRRAEQCKDRLASVLINGKKRKWIPYQNSNDSLQCRLTCLSEKTLDFLGTPYVVTDGTPCTYDDHHSICVRGECKKLGCNKRIGSAKSDDLCGICNGDNTDCVFVNKVFAETPRKRYRRVDVLPTGAYNIMVKERTNTSHFLALRYKSDKVYILNGGGTYRGWPSFVAGGARFNYSRENDHLASAGPLHDDLDILVYWTNDLRPINITYSYYLQRADVMSMDTTGVLNAP